MSVDELSIMRTTMTKSTIIIIHTATNIEADLNTLLYPPYMMMRIIIIKMIQYSIDES